MILSLNLLMFMFILFAYVIYIFYKKIIIKISIEQNLNIFNKSDKIEHNMITRYEYDTKKITKTR